MNLVGSIDIVDNLWTKIYAWYYQKLAEIPAFEEFHHKALVICIERNTFQ